MAKSYGGVLGSRKYPVELLTKKDGGPTVEDLANIAAQVAEVPRGSQRLIFKGSLFFVRCTYNRIHLLYIRLSTLFILTYLPTSGNLKSGDSLFYTTSHPHPQMSNAPTTPTPPPRQQIALLYYISQKLYYKYKKFEFCEKMD